MAWACAPRVLSTWLSVKSGRTSCSHPQMPSPRLGQAPWWNPTGAADHVARNPGSESQLETFSGAGWCCRSSLYLFTCALRVTRVYGAAISSHSCLGCPYLRTDYLAEHTPALLPLFYGPVHSRRGEEGSHLGLVSGLLFRSCLCEGPKAWRGARYAGTCGLSTLQRVERKRASPFGERRPVAIPEPHDAPSSSSA